jgi:hypothetical protein
MLSVSFFSENETASYQLLSIDGRILRTEILTNTKGTTNLDIPVHDLPTGTYLLKLITALESETQKFIKID